MKKYISANIAIVRMHSNIIATSSPETGANNELGDYENQLAPSRYRNERYDERYNQDYGL